MSESLYVIVRKVGDDSRVTARRVDVERESELIGLWGQFFELNRKVEQKLGYKHYLDDSGEMRPEFLEGIDELSPGLYDNIKKLEKEQSEREEVFVRNGFPKLEVGNVLTLSEIIGLQYKPKVEK